MTAKRVQRNRAAGAAIVGHSTAPLSATQTTATAASELSVTGVRTSFSQQRPQQQRSLKAPAKQDSTTTTNTTGRLGRGRPLARRPSVEDDGGRGRGVVAPLATADLRRLALRSKVVRISNEAYLEAMDALRHYLSSIIHDAVVMTENAKRITVSFEDVVAALERRGVAIYG